MPDVPYVSVKQGPIRIFDSRKAKERYTDYRDVRSSDFFVPPNYVGIVSIIAPQEYMADMSFTAIRIPTPETGEDTDCYRDCNTGKRYRRWRCDQDLGNHKPDKVGVPLTSYTGYNSSVVYWGLDPFSRHVVEFEYIVRPGWYFLQADRCKNNVLEDCINPTLIELSLMYTETVYDLLLPCGTREHEADVEEYVSDIEAPVVPETPEIVIPVPDPEPEPDPDPIVAVADYNHVVRGGEVWTDVLANDKGDELEITNVEGLTSGAGDFKIDEGGVIFAAEPGFTGPQAVAKYSVKDKHGQTASALLTIDFDAEKPVANPDYISVTAGGTAVIDPLMNDTGNGISLVSISTTETDHGSFTKNEDGTVSFHAPYGSVAWNQTAEVKTNYTIKDKDGQTATSTITVTITGEIPQ